MSRRKRHIKEMEQIAKSTEELISKWPKWKQDYHNYKKSLRHAPDGSIYYVKASQEANDG